MVRHLPNIFYLILKPDCVKRKLTGEIISRIERKNLTITKMEMRVLDREDLELHYEEHKDKPFFSGMVDFMAGGPVVILQVEGREVQKVMRTLNEASCEGFITGLSCRITTKLP